MRSGLVTVAFGLIVAALVLTGRGGEAQTTAAGIYIADRGNGRLVFMKDMTGGGWTAFPGTILRGLAGSLSGQPAAGLSSSTCRDLSSSDDLVSPPGEPGNSVRTELM